MNYMTLKEASEKWGISVRRINLLCSEGRLPGAVKRQNLWMIPSSSEKPSDGRRKKKPLKEPGILLRNVTYVETHAAADICDYDRALCECTRTFLEGYLEEGNAKLKSFIKTCNDKQYLLVAYFILSYNAIPAADVSALEDARKNIARLLKDPDVGDLTKALIRLKNPASSLPDPIFLSADPNIMEELSPYMTLQATRHLLIALIQSHYHEILLSPEFINLSIKDQNTPEAYVYCCIILSVYYSVTGSDQYSRAYLLDAASEALPRGWYTPLALYAFIINMEPIREIDPDAYKRIMVLSEMITNNYQKLDILSNNIICSEKKYIPELQVAYQLACGKTNAEIADHLGRSVYAVKKCISNIYARTGLSTRSEIKDYVLTRMILF